MEYNQIQKTYDTEGLFKDQCAREGRTKGDPREKSVDTSLLFAQDFLFFY